MKEKTWGQKIWDEKSAAHNEIGVVLGLGRSKKALDFNTQLVLSNLQKNFLNYLPKNASILDLGTGPLARFAIILTQLGYKVTGLDISKVSLEKARIHIQNANVMVDLKIADMTKFELGKIFDGMYCVETFFHVPPHLCLAAFNNFNQHLEIGGHLCVQFDIQNEITPRFLIRNFIYMSAYQILKPIYKWLGKKTFYVTVHRHSESEIADLALLSGFQVKVIDSNYCTFTKVSEPILKTVWTQ